jgi:glycosyltransferase involved in cell wall biosynthesis
VTGGTVSVVVPTFNRLGHLRAALDTVFAQTHQDWDLIVSDDGSNEVTRAFLRDVQNRPRVQVILGEHSGIPAVVRNAGLRRATGRYVAFLDSDDLWAPQKLERQLAALQSRPECLWSYTAFTQVDHQARVLPAEQTRLWRPHDGEIFEQVLRTTASIRTPSVIVTRQFLEDVGGFDETLPACEDYDLWMRLALKSPVALVDESLVKVRLHDENLTRDWAIAYHGRDRSLCKLAAVCGPRWRDLVLRERARNGIQLLTGHTQAGQPLKAIETVLRSAPFSWHYPFWWAGLVRTAARAYRNRNPRPRRRST